MKKSEINHELLASYLLNNLSTDEQQRVEQWLEASEENRELFAQFSIEWIHLNKDLEIDKDKVWANIEKHIVQTTPLVFSPHAASTPRKLIIKVASVAASIALLVGGVSSLAIKSSIDEKHRAESITTIETPTGQKMQMTLPDQTRVWLNSGSRISYSENFNKSVRELSLDGEAYFDVAENKDKEFVVKTSNIRVVVKGTSFDISAYAEDPSIDVSLLTGKVEITDNNSKLLAAMAPNEIVSVNKQSMLFTHNRNVENIYPLWAREQLVFYNADINEVMKKAERWYGVNIELENPTDEKYTFSVKTETLRELLYLFNKITPIDYEINGKKVKVQCK